MSFKIVTKIGIALTVAALLWLAFLGTFGSLLDDDDSSKQDDDDSASPGSDDDDSGAGRFDHLPLFPGLR